MAGTKGDHHQHYQQQPSQPFYYSPLPPEPNPNPNPYQPHHQDPQYYVLLPYHPTRRIRIRRRLICELLCFTSIILFVIAIFFLWPSDPEIDIVRIHLNHVHPHLSPSVSLDVSMAVTVKVRNRDYFSFRYDSVLVSIGYRGKELGVVNSHHGFMKARASSYVNATVVFDGIRVIHDVFYLIEDLTKGLIPFDTVTEVRGKLGLFFFHIPIKGKVSCEVDVDTDNQTITRQDCYPE